MMAYGGMDVYIYVFFTPALVGSEWSISPPGRFNPEEMAAGTHWIGGWVGTSAGLDARGEEKILDHIGTRTPLLSYPGFYFIIRIFIIFHLHQKLYEC
jgi:hypothetical protein